MKVWGFLIVRVVKHWDRLLREVVGNLTELKIATPCRGIGLCDL